MYLPQIRIVAGNSSAQNSTMPCPYCSSPHGRSVTTAAGRNITECTTCGRVISEYLTLPHHLFHLRANETSLPLATSDLPKYATTDASAAVDNEEDPFLPTGFITAFSTWSLEQYPVMARSTMSFAGHLAELERVLETTTSTGGAGNGTAVVVDNLRAYLQIIDVASILGIESDISEHAFQLFRDCSTATCLRNRSVEALATAALLRAIREAAEPRTLQELSMASNLPQKEIGKYMKILGEALQLSQPMNSNSISVHMPRFCNLLQLNKSAQELATHIGDVVVNKCFCTRRNPISISAAAIYLACQLEDKRKTQAEICKVTGLTEVTLRKVYKELLENWDDLLPSNYHPVVPPEKAFPTAIVASGRSSSSSSYKNDLIEATCSERDKNAELKSSRDMFNHIPPRQTKGKDSVESNDHIRRSYSQPPSFWKSQVALLCSSMNAKAHETMNSDARNMDVDADSSSLRQVQFPSVSNKGSGQWPFRPSMASPLSSSPVQFGQQMKMGDSVVEEGGAMQHDLNDKFGQ